MNIGWVQIPVQPAKLQFKSILNQFESILTNHSNFELLGKEQKKYCIYISCMLNNGAGRQPFANFTINNSQDRQSFADFAVNNSQGRQSLGESPSPSDCVGYRQATIRRTVAYLLISLRTIHYSL
ncbi:MAG: hypothetical protein LBU34_11375 [Planctomycetaceae bacterium]|jgi:hypothetical protein|nr:hypothetical protein [Planctomycetaceae bacterium]